MTISEAITVLDDRYPNDYTTADKRGWLSRVEEMLKRTVIDLHEDAGEVHDKINASTPATTELIMPEPYDEGYINWLQAQVCFYNHEIDKYNDAITLFNSSLDGFKAEYIRTHMPKPSGPFLF